MFKRKREILLEVCLLSGFQLGLERCHSVTKLSRWASSNANPAIASVRSIGQTKVVVKLEDPLLRSNTIVLCYDADLQTHLIAASANMTQVLQQRCLPTDMAQRPYPSFRSDRSPATQSLDQVAYHISDVSTVSGNNGVVDTGCPLPTFDLGPMLAPDHRPEAVEQLCQSVADCLRDTGCLVIRDPRVLAEDNMAFLDMMERYFAQSTAAKMQDSRPDLHFQVSTDLPLHVTRRRLLCSDTTC